MRFPSLFALLSLLLLSAAPARAVDETAFCASGADPCEFKGDPLTIDADTTLDFGSRTVIISNSKVINVTGGVRLTINAGTFIMRPGSQMQNAVVARGANITITTDDDIIMEKGQVGSLSRIEVPASQTAGNVQLTAGRDITIDGEIRANGTAADAEGGLVDMDAGRNVTLSGDIDLTGGSVGSGGELVVGADGPIVVGGPINAFAGFDGGIIDLSSNESLTTADTLDVRGTSGGSLGGSITITVVGSINIGGKVIASGAGSLTEGGSGGDIDMSAGASIVLTDVVDLSGGPNDGFGGIASFVADVDIIQKKPVFAVGSGPSGIGGDVSYVTGRLLSLEAPNDVSGSNQGGDFAGNARQEVQAKSDVIVSGEGVEGSGGTIQLDGLAFGVPQVSGNVVVSGSLRARGDGGTAGGGGSIVVQGCDVAIPGSGALNNFGDKAGNVVRASGLMTIAAGAQILARPTPGTGTNTIEFRDVAKPPVIDLNAVIDPMTAATRNAALPGCLPPVPPVCGDGDPTGVEGCDDGNLTSCDGCSGGDNGMTCHASGCCQVEACGNGNKECAEQCDDGNVFDGDGCDSNCTPTGCGNGRVTGNEECDDGNTTDGDGCSATCVVEPPPGCGNGMSDAGEECDDGNNNNCDGCSKICVIERCGNGVKECAEACDDGGTDACDGDCAADCSRPVGVCGDGVAECGEECDAGAANGAPGSACSGFCRNCAVGSGSDCPCGTDLDCAPTGKCAGLECVNGFCNTVDVPTCNDGNNCNGVETCVNGECTVPTPPACNDDDPCTDDTCNPVGGCPHPRKTGFPGITCRLDFIASAAGDASVADLPTKLRAKILKLAGGAKSRLESASTETKVKRQRKLLKAAESQLGKLVGVLSKALKKHQLADALGTRLREQADGARGAARTLRAGLTG